MIKTKADLLYYLEEDRKAYGKPSKMTIKERILNLFFPDDFCALYNNTNLIY